MKIGKVEDEKKSREDNIRKQMRQQWLEIPTISLFDISGKNFVISIQKLILLVTFPCRTKLEQIEGLRAELPHRCTQV